MKKLLIACSMVSACALVASANAPVQSTPKQNILPWFNVTTSATNGGVIAVNEGATCEVENNAFKIESELGCPVTFTATDSLTQDVAKVSVDLAAAYVPTDALATFTSESAPKVGFALCEDDNEAKSFRAWVGGSSWVALTGPTVPAEGTAYTLVMDFDNQNGQQKVRFSVTIDSTTTVLTATGATDGWIAYTAASPVAGQVALNFVGSCKITSFLGNQIIIEGEIIVIPDKGTVDVKTEDVAAFKKTIGDSGKTVDAFLAMTATEAFSGSKFASGLTVAEAYALGLVAKDGNGKMAPSGDNGAVKVTADAQASATESIPVSLNINPPPQTETGATVQYQLMGSKDGSVYTPIGSAVDSQTAIVIPTSDIGTYNFFKVKTILTLKQN